MLAKKANDYNGEFIVSGIPTAGASSAILSFVTNNGSEARATVTSNTTGITIGARTTSGSSAPITVTYAITIASGVTSFDLTFSNSNGSSNTRIDDIVLTATIGTAPITPAIETLNGDSGTISAGSLTGSISGIKLSNPLDNIGIVASTDADWMTVAFTEGNFETGAKLTATAKSYNHETEPRTATVTLKATGITKTVTFKQNASIVRKPSSLSVEPGNKTFTASWTGDTKVASYVAYYSTSSLDNPATGTSLSVSNEGAAFSATPANELVNGTTYYVYVKANDLTDEYSDKYVIVDEWAEATVTPVGIIGSVDNPLSAAEAIAVMQDLEQNVETTEFYYVAGTLNDDPSYFNKNTGVMTFTFVDEDNNIIKAYNCLGMNGTKFTAEDDLKQGDQVVVFGNLEKYVKTKDGVTTTEYEVVNGQLALLTPYVAPGAVDVVNQKYIFSQMGYSNAQDVSSISGTNCSIGFTNAKYYTSGTALRVYGGGSITVTAASGYKITSIKFEFGSSDGSNTITANSGAYSNGVWSGTIADGGSVVFSIGGSSGNRRFASIEIN